MKENKIPFDSPKKLNFTVYGGPSNQITKSYEPEPDRRTNSLSKKPGGSTITVVFKNYEINYTNIKYPDSYIRKIKSEKKGVVKILVDGQVWEDYI